MEQLERRVARLAGQLAMDPRFDEALGGFCRGISGWFRQDLHRIAVFGDLGQMMTVAAGFAWQGERGVTIARIIRLVSGSGVASPRRVRAICDNMERLGIVAPAPGRQGHREKPLCFGGWLQTALLLWLDIYVQAVTPWFDTTAPVDRAALTQVLGRHVDALEHYGLDLLRDWPEVQFFMEHIAGYPLLMELIVARPGAPGPSRKSLARAHGVSRPHIAGLIAHGEGQRWIDTGTDGRAISLTSATRSRLRAWVAREFAAVILALKGDRPGAPM